MTELPLVWAGFRSHLLLPRDVVGTIMDDRPTWRGISFDGSRYYRNGLPVAELTRTGNYPDLTVLRFTALAELWLQEPGLTVKFAAGGTWRGYRRNPFGWTSDELTVDGDAYRQTVHFSRVKTNLRYTDAVRHRNGGEQLLTSGYGFTKLLDLPAEPEFVPWQGCEVFGEGYDLAGTYVNPNEVLRRWELAGHPSLSQDWMHFLGWTGGPGCVVNAAGLTPPPGTDVTAADGYDRLYNPRSWRRLLPGEYIQQGVVRL